MRCKGLDEGSIFLFKADEFTQVFVAILQVVIEPFFVDFLHCL